MEIFSFAKVLGMLAASIGAIGFFLLVKDRTQLGLRAAAAFCLIWLVLIFVVLLSGGGTNGHAGSFLFASVSLFIGFGVFGVVAAISGACALLADGLLRRLGIAAPLWVGALICLFVAIILSLMWDKPFGWA